MVYTMTDHAKFIDRHQNRSKNKTERKGSRKVLSLAIVVSIISLYLVIVGLVVHMAHVDQTTIAAAVLVFLTSTLVAFVARRAQYLQAKQEKELVLLKEVLEGSRGARLITNENDQTLYYNQKFAELCESPQDQCGYNNILEMFSANDKAESLLRALEYKANMGLSESIELYCEKQDYQGWYCVTAQPVTGYKDYIHWRIDNVTQKHTEDRAVHEEREKLIDFTDNAPVGFFSLDENGRFIFMNATMARWIGRDIKDLLGDAKLHTYLCDPPENSKPYDILQSGGATQIADVEMKGIGGKPFLVSVNQNIIKDNEGRVRTRAVVHDLTAEREIRRALKLSEERFKRFYEEAPLGIILVNENGLIENCNSEFARMMGKATDELEGKHFKLLISDNDRDSVLNALKRLEDDTLMAESMEVTLKTNDKEYISTQLHARRFREGGGTVLHFIDMREKKSLEAQFVQSQKMQAVGQLAGGIAHDFNNLLTAMIGFCDLLLLRHKPGDPSFSDIMQIKQNSNRAANLVRQLLAFSRQQTLRQRIHDITDILTELSHLMRRLLGANVELEMIHGPDLGLVKVDEGQMEQVLINLAVNARDAMQGGGKLMITTENYTNRKEKEVMQEKMPAGHWILIKVSDTGHGISKENIGRIFEPFFTTKGVGEGTGLGLATVYGIIRQSGGFLDIESEVGKGTTFFMYLPRSNEAEDEAEDEAKTINEEKDLTGSECIMLVEDEAAVRTFSQRALMNKGYDVISAEDGETALNIFNKEGQKTVNLLITDVVMPGMDGPTLAQNIRKENPDLKIIFMSGYTEDKLKDHMGKNIYFLPKPFTLKALATKVKEVLDE